MAMGFDLLLRPRNPQAATPIATFADLRAVFGLAVQALITGPPTSHDDLIAAR